MSSTVNTVVHAICKCSQGSLKQKVLCFGSLGPIPMIQSPLCSTWSALQHYNIDWNEVVAIPELRKYYKNWCKISFQLMTLI